jgi:hypothetical protein
LPDPPWRTADELAQASLERLSPKLSARSQNARALEIALQKSVRRQQRQLKLQKRRSEQLKAELARLHAELEAQRQRSEHLDSVMVQLEGDTRGTLEAEAAFRASALRSDFLYRALPRYVTLLIVAGRPSTTWPRPPGSAGPLPCDLLRCIGPDRGP